MQIGQDCLIDLGMTRQDSVQHAGLSLTRSVQLLLVHTNTCGRCWTSGRYHSLNCLGLAGLCGALQKGVAAPSISSRFA